MCDACSALSVARDTLTDHLLGMDSLMLRRWIAVADVPSIHVRAGDLLIYNASSPTPVRVARAVSCDICCLTRLSDAGAIEELTPIPRPVVPPDLPFQPLRLVRALPQA